MTNPRSWQWPYAAKAIVQHEFDVDHLNVYLIFRFSMDINKKPADELWLCVVDSVEKEVTASEWIDEYTIKLTVDNVDVIPLVVTLEYDGPSALLETTWEKQWEPWGPIVSELISPVISTRTFSTGPAQQDAVDVSNVNVLFIDCSANAVTIAGFVGGVNGQRLFIARLCTSGNDITLKYNIATGNQEIHLHAGLDESLTGEYGGWVLVCDGSNWYDCSHAKHV